MGGGGRQSLSNPSLHRNSRQQGEEQEFSEIRINCADQWGNAANDFGLFEPDSLRK
jgi:hypothetical protein